MGRHDELSAIHAQMTPQSIRDSRKVDGLASGDLKQFPGAFRKGVTDTAYYSNSGMNPYEAGHERLVDLAKREFVGRQALREVAEEGAKRKTIGLFWARRDMRNTPITDTAGLSERAVG
jgi:hypothetical protein